MTAPRRPRKVTIGPHTHKIEWPAKIGTSKADAKRNLLGLAHLTTGRIEIRSKDQSPTQQASTLIHEILHHIFNDTAIDQTAGWSPDVEEFVIASIESRLLELFSPANAPVVAWLQNPESG